MIVHGGLLQTLANGQEPLLHGLRCAGHVAVRSGFTGKGNFGVHRKFLQTSVLW